MFEREKFNSLSVDEFVAEYLQSTWLSDSDGPIDDLLNLLKIASFLGKSHPDMSEFEKQRKPTISELIKPFAQSAEACCPSLTPRFWEEVMARTLAQRYGGTTVYLKIKKSISYDDVKHLTPKQIMEKHGKSRAYAYKLLSKK
ncbi:MAG: hypothetical protein FD131_4888 [Rhodocyclaceae bacterium]|nr:MAG: hypothetical protein FD131_4888 [Rhodocyclaceae bacterium]